jgi:hypothetical protein
MGAFCEDFEAQTWSTTWSDFVLHAGAKGERGNESASVGGAALRVISATPESEAFLLHEEGEVRGQWSGTVGFAFRIDALPVVSLTGPSWTVKEKDGPVSLRIKVTPESVLLEQTSEATCRRDRCQPSVRVLAPAQATHWYRVRLGVEVDPRTAPPYGRLETTVDGGPVTSADLTIPFFGGASSVRAGITQGDVTRAFANVDDVSILVRNAQSN